MIGKKYLIPVCLIITFLTLLITILFINGKNFDLESIPSEEETYTDGSWEISGAKEINLSSLSSIPKDSGAVSNDGSLMIISGGDYFLTGSLDSGKILIDANKEDKIHLYLDNININSGDQAALEIDKAGSVIITTKEGSKSTFTSNLDGESSDVDGIIYSRSDLAINGPGSIKIDAQNSHGLVCNDSLYLGSTTFDINSGMDAIHVNDSVEITESTLNLKAIDDAITVKNDDNNGSFLMNSGNINVISCTEGIEASNIQIDSGKVDISFTDDGINATGESPLITVNGGDINILCETGQDSDGLDSNGDIILNGGNIFINVGGQGMNSAIDVATETGGKCEINGGTLSAFSGEGTETLLESSSQGIIRAQSQGNTNSIVELKENGTVVLNKTVPFNFTNVIISTPDIKSGQSYDYQILF